MQIALLCAMQHTVDYAGLMLPMKRVQHSKMWITNSNHAVSCSFHENIENWHKNRSIPTPSLTRHPCWLGGARRQRDPSHRNAALRAQEKCLQFIKSFTCRPLMWNIKQTQRESHTQTHSHLEGLIEGSDHDDFLHSANDVGWQDCTSLTGWNLLRRFVSGTCSVFQFSFSLQP